MPAPQHSSFFTDRMPFLLPNQQRQSTEGAVRRKKSKGNPLIQVRMENGHQNEVVYDTANSHLL